MRHHSATHLLQRAIRDVLGSHAHQSGSFVDDKRLRFDFTHFAALSPEELQQIEDGVNHLVLADLTIATESMAKDKAMALGAMALFSEKYGDEVRVVTMGDRVSVELCGGTHCRSTGEIGCVKIISEASVSAGLRRIEAYAGRLALAHYRALSGMVAGMADHMKCAPTEIMDRLAALQARIKEQENKIRELNIKIATGVSAASGEEVLDGTAGKVVIKRVETEDVSQMREVGDRIKERIRSGIVLLTSPGNDKLTLMIMTTQDSSRTWDAGKIMKQIMDGTGGRGGGKALFAQGGADNAMMDKAIAIFKQSTGV
jgi:alanyl-tRNA synthetase